MAFNPDYLNNLSQSNSTTSLMVSANPGKGTGKRKKNPFRKKPKHRLVIPASRLPKKYRSTKYAQVADPYLRMALDDNPVMKATTARNNDGMSFVW